MDRRYRLPVTIVALAMHVLAPIGAHAAIPAAGAPGDYCSSAARATVAPEGGARAAPRLADASPGTPAPRPAYSPHSHCPSCTVISLAIALPVAQAPLAVRPPPLAVVATGPVRVDTATSSALRPPLRGPPPVPA